MIQGVSPLIESILAAGNQAPSSLNSQPWRFAVVGNRIEVHVSPEKDQNFYDWDHRMSYFTIGGVIENMVIAASAVGYKTNVIYFPSPGSTIVALVELSAEPGIRPDSLEPEIFLRVTNRKKFMPVKMSDKEKQDLISAARADDHINLALVDDRQAVKELAEVAAIDDHLIFSIRSLHEYYFAHINWTRQIDQMRKTGLHTKELELSPVTVAMHYLLSDWQLVELLDRFGLSNFMGKQNLSIYSSASAIGCIFASSDEPAEFIKAGRTFERLWLAVAKSGLYLQPLNGVPYLQLGLEHSDAKDVTPEQKEMIESGYKTAQKIFAAEGKRIVSMFRIGGGAAPSGHTSRRELAQIVTTA